MAGQYLFYRMSVKLLHGLYKHLRICECLDSAALSVIFSSRGSPLPILTSMLLSSFQPPSNATEPMYHAVVKVYATRLLSSLSSFLQVFLKYTVKMHCLQK